MAARCPTGGDLRNPESHRQIHLWAPEAISRWAFIHHVCDGQKFTPAAEYDHESGKVIRIHTDGLCPKASFMGQGGVTNRVGDWPP